MDGFSVVLPAYNEASSLRSTLERLLAYLRTYSPSGAWELIVVDDGSRDATPAIVDAFQRRDPARVQFVRHPVNLGLSAALESGAAIARGTTTVVIDADLSYAPETIGALVAAQRETGAACALASPYMRGGTVANVPPVRLAASVVANILLSACARGRVKTLTGMARAYETPLLRDLLGRRGRAEFNSWSVADMLAAKLPLVEVPARLAWPEHRRRAAARLGSASLWRRTTSVLRSAGYLLRPSRKASGVESGTFVPPELGDRLMSGHR